MQAAAARAPPLRRRAAHLGPSHHGRRRAGQGKGQRASLPSTLAQPQRRRVATAVLLTRTTTTSNHRRQPLAARLLWHRLAAIARGLRSPLRATRTPGCSRVGRTGRCCAPQRCSTRRRRRPPPRVPPRRSPRSCGSCGSASRAPSEEGLLTLSVSVRGPASFFEGEKHGPGGSSLLYHRSSVESTSDSQKQDFSSRYGWLWLNLVWADSMFDHHTCFS